MEGRFEKLKIDSADDSKSFESFFVLFNPTEYSIEDASRWEDQDKMGQKPEMQYTGGERKKLSMELFYDTYESKSDVREHTSKVANLLVVDRETHRPPKVTLTWGLKPPGGPHADFPFVCVLQSLKQQFILFLSDGTPVRAKLAVVFVEFTLPAEELKVEERSSPDHTKAYVVKTGDTLSGIAGMFYKDPRLWRPIAQRNDVANPRDLQPGQVLTIPQIV